MKEQSIYKVEQSRQLSVRQSLPAVLMIGLGVFLLAANLFNFHLMSAFWPGFIIAPGLLLLWPTFNSTAEQQSRLSFLAVPGAVLLAVGLLLFGMNLTDHFEAWAYSWTLVVAAAAIGLMYVKRFDPNDRIHQSGYKFVRAMVILFMALAVFFEVVVFENFNPLLPLALIGYGVYTLIKERRARQA